jgi:hypothetical protein
MIQVANPSQNSNGQSAAQSALLADTDHELRVPYFCEENVWRLAYKKIRESPENRFYVCFVSNADKTVAMCHQLAGRSRNEPVYWDYHVILLRWSRDKQVLVFDIDSSLPYPQPLDLYLRESFSSDNMAFAPPFAPQFKIIPADLYLQYFASDRMHMYNTKSQTWNAPPPPYECIGGLSTSHNKESPEAVEGTYVSLQQYLNFDAEQNEGEATLACVVPEEALGRMLSLEALTVYDFDLAL